MPLDSIIGAFALAASLSMDAFAASFAYGSGKIKIPFSSVQVISFMCTGLLAVSLLLGSAVRGLLPQGLTTALCFLLLMLLGIAKLLDSITKSIIRKHSNINRKVRFSMFNFKFILSLYADPEKADVDLSRSISPSEAVSLSAALSLDGLAAGFSAAMGDISIPAVIIASLIVTTAAVMLGSALGNKLAGKQAGQRPFDLSWLGGVILIILAFTRL